jgi:periplasmic protein TonB
MMMNSLRMLRTYTGRLLNVGGADSRVAIRADFVLWGGSFLLAAALHVGAVFVLQPDPAEGENAGDTAVVLELDIVPTAPNEGQSEVTPGPQQVQIDQISQASPAQEEVPERTQKEEQDADPPKVDVAQAPEPEVAMPDARRTPDRRPDEQKQKQDETEKQRQLPSEARPESAPTSAPQAAALIAPQVVTTAGAPVEDTAALVSWRAHLNAHVERFKRYPAEAIARRLHGTAMIRFTIDRTGAVLSAVIVRPSGAAVLDQEAVRLLSRAAPLPAAPANVAGAHFTFTIPVRFHPQR